MIEGISVVVPNYNGVSLLPQVLPPAIAALRNTGLPYEIIVVDDCSWDNSVRLVREKFPEVKLLVNGRNSGFSITANTGIKQAGFSWVLLLNSDVKLEPDYFGSLLKYTQRSGVFGVMGRIVGWNDDIIQDGAKYPFFHGGKIKTSGNYLLEDKEKMRDGVYSMYVSGANAFLNRDIFLKIGGFNELFSPYYAEDTEVSFRAWRLGYTCYYDYYAVCRHKTSSTILNARKKRHVDIVYNRNKMFLHAIHLGPAARCLWLIQLVPEVLIKSLLLRWDYAQSFFLFLKNYPAVRKSRRVIRQLAGEKPLLSVRDFFRFILNSIKDQKIVRI
jgi:GT2 family glycosyltransferase